MDLTNGTVSGITKKKEPPFIEIETGIIVRGLKNENLEPFSSEALDHAGRLLSASVNAIEGSKDIIEIMKGMDELGKEGNRKYGYCIADVKKIRKKRGKVIITALPDNKNHCEIFGLKLADANNAFSKKYPFKKKK